MQDTLNGSALNKRSFLAFSGMLSLRSPIPMENFICRAILNFTLPASVAKHVAHRCWEGDGFNAKPKPPLK